MISKMYKFSKSFAIVSLLAITGFSSIANAGGHKSAGPGDIVDVAAGAGSFNTLVAAVKAAAVVAHIDGYDAAIAGKMSGYCAPIAP